MYFERMRKKKRKASERRRRENLSKISNLNIKMTVIYILM
jgi:hypothetical protein